ITFDGKGNYTTNAVLYDGAANQQQTFNFSGTYSIAASGYGFLSGLLTDDAIYGLVSQGIFIGGSTENQNGFNDLMIAAPLANPQPTIGSLRGTYALLDLDMPDGTPPSSQDCILTMTADGNGNLTNLSAKGYVAANGTAVVTQSFGSLKYVASNGGFN